MDVIFAQIIAALSSVWAPLPNVIFVVGILRMILKPLMALIQAFVDATPDQEDNKLFSGFLKSPAYTTLVFLLDWLASIKIKSK